MIKKLEEVQAQEEPQCITQHPGFHAVALNHWALQAVYLSYAKDFNDVAEMELHKLVLYHVNIFANKCEMKCLTY